MIRASAIVVGVKSMAKIQVRPLDLDACAAFKLPPIDKGRLKALEIPLNEHFTLRPVAVFVGNGLAGYQLKIYKITPGTVVIGGLYFSHGICEDALLGGPIFDEPEHTLTHYPTRATRLVELVINYKGSGAMPAPRHSKPRKAKQWFFPDLGF